MNNCISNLKSLILLTLILCLTFVGCKKKEPQSPFESKLPEYDSIVTTISNEEIEESIKDDGKVEEVKVVSIEVDNSSSMDPTPEQVQVALKNAGYYKGEVDGKIGPMSKEAVISFQRNKGLVADGKVGPKTWAKLKDYLNPQNSD